MRVRWVYRSSLAVQVLCGVVNVYVGVRVFMIAKSPISYNVNVVQPQSFPTNSVPVSAPEFPVRRSHSVTNSSSVANSSSAPPHVPVRYSSSFFVFVDRGETFFRSAGRDYKIGDLHAYGKVSSIFPERVYFSNGDYLDNLPTHQTPTIRSNDEQRRNDTTSS